MRLRSCVAAAAVSVLLLAAGAAPAAPQKLPMPAGKPLVGPIPPEEPPPPYPPLDRAPAEAVRAAWHGYATAVFNRDGAAAARLVTRRSRGYFARMRDMAVSAPEAQVRAAPLMDRLTILMLRHRVPADELRALTGDAVFAYTIDRGWAGSGASRRAPARVGGEVFGQGDRAVLRMGADNLHFVREDGSWRLDVVRVFEEAPVKVPAGTGEDEFVLFTLEVSTGRKASPDIWQPLP